MRLHAYLASLLGAVAVAAAPAAPDGQDITLTVRVPAGRAWVSYQPLTHDGATWLSPVSGAPEEPFHLRAKRGIPAVVCAGASGMAAKCARVAPADDQSLSIPLDEGREVLGRVSIGRAPAAATLSFLLPIESRRAPAVPLRRDGDRLVTTVATAPNGSFRIDHLSPGRYLVEIGFSNGRTETSEALVPPRKNDRRKEPVRLPDLRVDPGARITVSVRDADGLPVPHAGVGVSQQGTRDERPHLYEGYTDAEGEVAIEGVSLQLGASVTCSAPGFVRDHLRFAVPPSTALCTLRRFASVRATAEDDGGKPLPAAHMSLAGGALTSTADEAGHLILGGVEPGVSTVRITAPGHRAWLKDVTIASGEAQDLGEIRLADGDAIRGTVVDGETGRPLPSASVRGVLSGGSTQTDDEGRFELTDDPAAGVRVEAAGFAPRMVPLTASAEPVVVRMERPGTLEVTAWDGDGRCVGCVVIADRPDVSVSGTTGGDGVVRFADLPPGEYQVSREHVVSGTAYVHVHGGDIVQLATVRPRQTTQLDLGRPAAPIRVSVFPAMPAGWQLTASTPTRSETLAPDAAGFFLVHKRDEETATLRLVRGTESMPLAVIPAHYAAQDFVAHVQQ